MYDESFEDSLARRLHAALDTLDVHVPDRRPLPGLARRYGPTSALLALLVAGLVAGSTAAAGSPNPVAWVKAVGHSLGFTPAIKPPATVAVRPVVHQSPESTKEPEPTRTGSEQPEPTRQPSSSPGGWPPASGERPHGE